jgi:hypothetical protein
LSHVCILIFQHKQYYEQEKIACNKCAILSLCVDHVLVKCVGIGSLPLASSSCKNPPAPMAHDLLMFRFMITFALSVVMGKGMHYGS